MTNNQFAIQVRGLSKDLYGMRKAAQNRFMNQEFTKILTMIYSNLNERIANNPFSDYYYCMIDYTQFENKTDIKQLANIINSIGLMEVNKFLSDAVDGEEMVISIKEANESFIAIEARIKEERA